MPRRFSRALSVMVVALLGGLYGQISPASGAPANDSSTFMAGYVLDPAPGAVSAAVHFTLPALTCPSTGSVLLGAMAFAPDGTRTGGEMLGYCSGLEGSGPAYWVAVFEFNRLSAASKVRIGRGRHHRGPCVRVGQRWQGFDQRCHLEEGTDRNHEWSPEPVRERRCRF